MSISVCLYIAYEIYYISYLFYIYSIYISCIITGHPLLGLTLQGPIP